MADIATIRRLPLVLDRSWDRTPLARFAASGCVGMVGYLSWDPSKNWTRALIEECWAAGMWAALNWEGRGDWTEFSTGADGGARAGREAGRLAAELGAPTSLTIVVSADYDVQPAHHPAIAAWLDAFRRESGHPVGIYGEADLVDVMLDTGHASYGWQTNAYGWSGGRISDKAGLVQIYGNAGMGAEVDENRLRDAAGIAWYAHGPSPSAPVQEDDMNRADTIALLRAPEFSQAETRKQVAALAKQVADQNKAILLLLKALNDTVNKPS